MNKPITLTPEGLEEAEMYASLAGDLLIGVADGDEAECRLEGAKALIEKSRAIMRRLIKEELAHG